MTDSEGVAWTFAEANIPSTIASYASRHKELVTRALDSKAHTSHAGPPDLVSPVLDLFARRFNYGYREGWDWQQFGEFPLSTAESHWFTGLMPRLAATAGNPAADERRAWLATDWLVRRYAPTWLREGPVGIWKHAAVLEALPVLTTEAAAALAMSPLIEAVYAEIDFEGPKATTTTDEMAVCCAVGGASFAVARSAAAYGALIVGKGARGIAWRAAMVRSGEPQEFLDNPVGLDWDWHNRPVTPVVRWLQGSALDLLHRMIDVQSDG